MTTLTREIAAAEIAERIRSSRRRELYRALSVTKQIARELCRKSHVNEATAIGAIRDPKIDADVR
jgi:uncharacterized membrane protein